MQMDSSPGPGGILNPEIQGISLTQFAIGPKVMNTDPRFLYSVSPLPDIQCSTLLMHGNKQSMDTGIWMGEGKRSQLTDYLSGTRREVDEALKELVSGLDGSEILPYVRYPLMSRGKRLRPIIVILSGSCFDRGRDLMDLAISFELLHTATLVHDDIIDGDEVRRNRPAAHVRWSVDSAILVGDALIALSVGLASGFGSEIIELVSQAAYELCEGEYMDMNGRVHESEDSYIETISRKSGALFRAAARCGALAGGANPQEAGVLACFGQKFGIAYQLSDDLRDDEIGDGSVLEQWLGEYCEAAKGCLQQLPDSAGRRYLSGMADLLASSGLVT